MRAHQIEGGEVVNTIEVEELDSIPGLNLIDADLHPGKIGDLWDGSVLTSPPPVIVIPQRATRYQIRMALVALGKIADVKAVIDASVDLEFIEYWNSKDSFGRDDAHMDTMASELGYGDAQKDTLFINASLIQ